MADDPLDLDATAQAALVATGEVSAPELIEAAIARIEERNPELNAVIHPRFDAARAEAAGDLGDGPFRGVPMVVKDLDGFQAGEPYHAGITTLRDRDFRPTQDTELNARFRRAGFVVVGRTNTPELGLVPTTEPISYGPTRNPWDPERSTGGSSGGSAAAVASRMVAVGHAGDGGGSIRIPASECGLVGLFPTRGRITLGPEVGEAWGGLVRRFVVCRSVRDAAAVLDAVAGPLPGDPYVTPPTDPYLEALGGDPGRLRVGITTTPPDPMVTTDPQVAAATEAAGALLASVGHDVEEAHPAAWDDQEWLGAFTGHFVNAMAVWTASELDRLGRLSGGPIPMGDLEPGTAALAEMAGAVSGVTYAEAVGAMHEYTRRLSQFWAPGPGGYDLLLTPTIPELPPRLGEFAGTDDNPLAGVFRAAAIVPFTVPFNVSGQPAVSLPLGWSDEGLPIGAQLVAAAGREDLLVAVASQLEAAAPWAERRPPTVGS